MSFIDCVRSDVGGGSVPNDTRYSLARIPLRWMIRECFKCDTGIIFDAAQLQQAGLRVTMQEDKPVLSELPARIILHVPPYSGSGKRAGETFFSKIVQHLASYVWCGVKFVQSLFWRKRTSPGTLPLLDLDDPTTLREQSEDYEALEELEDAISPLYDQLQARASWHLLEWIPLPVKDAKAILQKAEDGNSYTWT